MTYFNKTNCQSLVLNTWNTIDFTHDWQRKDWLKVIPFVAIAEVAYDIHTYLTSNKTHHFAENFFKAPIATSVKKLAQMLWVPVVFCAVIKTAIICWKCHHPLTQKIVEQPKLTTVIVEKPEAKEGEKKPVEVKKTSLLLDLESVKTFKQERIKPFRMELIQYSKLTPSEHNASKKTSSIADLKKKLLNKTTPTFVESEDRTPITTHENKLIELPESSAQLISSKSIASSISSTIIANLNQLIRFLPPEDTIDQRNHLITLSKIAKTLEALSTSKNPSQLPIASTSISPITGPTRKQVAEFGNQILRTFNQSFLTLDGLAQKTVKKLLSDRFPGIEKIFKPKKLISGVVEKTVSYPTIDDKLTKTDSRSLLPLQEFLNSMLKK